MNISGIKIGDRIVGKKTGTLTPSTVVGLVPARIYKSGNTSCTYDRWNELYPDWEVKYIVLSEFDEPTVNMTYEEFKLGYQLPEKSEDAFINDMIKNPVYYENFVTSQYKVAVQPITLIAYPIDDVDVI